MQNKEIEDNTFKISIPLITNAELNAIDDNLDDFVNQITKQIIHDKDLLVAQHIIKRQKQYINQLENKVKELEYDNHNKENKITEQETFLQMSAEVIKNSLLKQVIRGKIEELNKQCGDNVFHIQQTINAEIRLLQELLEEK